MKEKGNGRISFGRIKETLPMPDLISIQLNSYEWFLQADVPAEKRKNQGLQQVFKETFPIVDVNEKLILDFVEYRLGEPKWSERECRERDATYAVPLYVKLRLISRETGEIREQEVFLRELPLMTPRGTFIINGAERVIVSQIHRSPGVFYEYDQRTRLYSGRIIPYHGIWVELETDTNDVIYVRLAKKRRIPATILIRAIGYGQTSQILNLFYKIKEVALPNKTILRRFINRVVVEDVVDPKTGDTILPFGKMIEEALVERIWDARDKGLKIIDEESPDPCIINTLMRDETTSQDEALLKIYSLLRPGEPPTIENATALLKRLFFDRARYDLGQVGRYKLNQKLGLKIPEDVTILTKDDIVEAIRYIVKLHTGEGEVDDIDHLGNRRVRSVGELLQNQLRIGFARLVRGVKERMSIQDADIITPQSVVNVKPISAAINEFFGSNQLSQFMDQTNPLAELTHKRRLSALGQGGLSKERAGFEVRDVHSTHYGRICPIETPEGPNIGLIVSLSTYARVNQYGFIETPYRRVRNGRVTNEIVYLSADKEEEFAIAQPSEPVDEKGNLLRSRILCRKGREFPILEKEDVDFVDVSPKQLISISTSLIPFLEHDDANRALMGSNMQRQAVPLLCPEAPIIGTGVEAKIAHDSAVCVIAEEGGVVDYVSSDKIVITSTKGPKIYKLLKYQRSNQSTCLNQRPIVRKGQKVKAGEVIADGASVDGGELALGRNIFVAFMPWEGYNFEDAIIISERLVRDDIFTSIHIERFDVEARETQLGREVITRDIPNLGEDALKNLDENGIVRIGAEVKPGDILVGKVTPKGETELSPEYKLLHSIFGEKAREVRDTSLRVPYGNEGVVIDVHHFSRSQGDELSTGVEELVKVYVVNRRKITVGDKMAGRHGNKGVISKILPEEDMPFLEDGTPVDLILNPLSVPSRMNIGQILETHLGWVAKKLGVKFACPVFEGATKEEIKELMRKVGIPEDGKVTLYDGRTGEPFHQKVTVGYIYMMKLAHLVEDKIHARSTGPYSLVTQQPLGGKAQFGGQRLGEMEVWALEAYGASHALQELLTVKSDDIIGRAKVYEAIVKGENPQSPGIPESFNVLARELQGLALDVKVLNNEGKELDIKELDEIRRTREEGSALDALLRSRGDESKKDVAKEGK
jgi:DNA-directed RNA polymerase subunit beta